LEPRRGLAGIECVRFWVFGFARPERPRLEARFFPRVGIGSEWMTGNNKINLNC
jgi:hypothetical protein